MHGSSDIIRLLFAFDWTLLTLWVGFVVVCFVLFIYQTILSSLQAFAVTHSNFLVYFSKHRTECLCTTPKPDSEISPVVSCACFSVLRWSTQSPSNNFMFFQDSLQNWAQHKPCVKYSQTWGAGGPTPARAASPAGCSGKERDGDVLQRESLCWSWQILFWRDSSWNLQEESKKERRRCVSKWAEASKAFQMESWNCICFCLYCSCFSFSTGIVV